MALIVHHVTVIVTVQTVYTLLENVLIVRTTQLVGIVNSVLKDSMEMQLNRTVQVC